MDLISDCVCSSDGYIAVDHVELDIKEMLELGKKAAITRQSSTNIIEPEVASMGSRYVWETYTHLSLHGKEKEDLQLFCLFLRTSNHYPLSTESCKYSSSHIHNNSTYLTYLAAVWKWWCCVFSWRWQWGVDLWWWWTSLHSHWNCGCAGSSVSPR